MAQFHGPALPPFAVLAQDAGAPEYPLTPRVAVLACGPSIRETWDDREDFTKFDLVVAINDAPWPRPGTNDRPLRHHWIAASDAHILKPVLEGKVLRPMVGALTNRGFGPQFEKQGLKWIRPHTFSPDGPLGKKHTSYSFVAAVWFALRAAGPTGTVDIHGFDASQTPSITGIDKAHSHKNARWRSEAELLKIIWDERRIVNHGKVSQSLLAQLAGRAPL